MEEEFHFPYSRLDFSSVIAEVAAVVCRADLRTVAAVALP